MIGRKRIRKLANLESKKRKIEEKPVEHFSLEMAKKILRKHEVNCVRDLGPYKPKTSLYTKSLYRFGWIKEKCDNLGTRVHLHLCSCPDTLATVLYGYTESSGFDYSCFERDYSDAKKFEQVIKEITDPSGQFYKDKTVVKDSKYDALLSVTVTDPKKFELTNFPLRIVKKFPRVGSRARTRAVKKTTSPSVARLEFVVSEEQRSKMCDKLGVNKIEFSVVKSVAKKKLPSLYM